MREGERRREVGERGREKERGGERGRVFWGREGGEEMEIVGDRWTETER